MKWEGIPPEGGGERRGAHRRAPRCCGCWPGPEAACGAPGDAAMPPPAGPQLGGRGLRERQGRQAGLA